MIHPYLDLQMGTVEQYTKIIALDDLGMARQAGWQTYQDIALPAGDETAAALYGTWNPDNQMLVFNRPKTLLETGIAGLLGQTILGFSTHLGSYGMGGPGFVGLLLSSGQYLVYAVWGAASYALLDDRAWECYPDLYEDHRPWLSHFGGDLSWDDLSPVLDGAKIVEAVLSDEYLSLQLECHGESKTLFLTQTDARLPHQETVLKPAFDHGVIAEYLLWQDQDAILIV
jgi:hypothetical protein